MPCLLGHPHCPFFDEEQPAATKAKASNNNEMNFS